MPKRKTTSKTNDNNGSGWNAYRNLLNTNLLDIKKQMGNNHEENKQDHRLLEVKIQNVQKKLDMLKPEVDNLKKKSTLWGSVSGALTFAIIWVLNKFMGG